MSVEHGSNPQLSLPGSACSTLPLLKKSKKSGPEMTTTDKAQTNGRSEPRKSSKIDGYCQKQGSRGAPLDTEEITMLLKKEGDEVFLKEYLSQKLVISKVYSELKQKDYQPNSNKPVKAILKKSSKSMENLPDIKTVGKNGIHHCSAPGKENDSRLQRVRSEIRIDGGYQKACKEGFLSKEKAKSRSRLAILARKGFLADCFSPLRSSEDDASRDITSDTGEEASGSVFGISIILQGSLWRHLENLYRKIILRVKADPIKFLFDFFFYLMLWVFLVNFCYIKVLGS